MIAVATPTARQIVDVLPFAVFALGLCCQVRPAVFGIKPAGITAGVGEIYRIAAKCG